MCSSRCAPPALFASFAEELGTGSLAWAGGQALYRFKSQRVSSGPRRFHVECEQFCAALCDVLVTRGLVWPPRFSMTGWAVMHGTIACCKELFVCHLDIRTPVAGYQTAPHSAGFITGKRAASPFLLFGLRSEELCSRTPARKGRGCRGGVVVCFEAPVFCHYR